MIFYSGIGFRFKEFGPGTSPQNSYNMVLTTFSTLFPLFHGNVVPYLPDSFGLDLSGEKGLPPPLPPSLPCAMHTNKYMQSKKLITPKLLQLLLLIYLTTFIASTLIILLPKKCRNVQFFFYSNEKKIVKESNVSNNISFVKIKFSKFIRYSINMCQNH